MPLRKTSSQPGWRSQSLANQILALLLALQTYFQSLLRFQISTYDQAQLTRQQALRRPCESNQLILLQMSLQKSHHQ